LEAGRTNGNDEFQALVGKLQDEELRLLALRNAETERDRSQTKIDSDLRNPAGDIDRRHRGLGRGARQQQARAAEEALQQSEEKYRMLLDGVQDYAIFMLDPRGQVISWSAARS
jgi:PAS domain-containing protein